MTLEQLRMFVVVAERQHITRAAEALHLTPSGVSAAIASLETRHSAKLFHRVGRGIELTEAGALFLVEARAVLARAERAELVLSELVGLKRGTLRLAPVHAKAAAMFGPWQLVSPMMPSMKEKNGAPGGLGLHDRLASLPNGR